MPSSELNQKRRELNKAYRSLFGYTPSPSDYACSSCEYFAAIAKAVEEKKISATICQKELLISTVL